MPVERALVCARGHHFDAARSGYFNLLQPQDKRSKNPGDTKAAVTARHRFLHAGHEDPIVREILNSIEKLQLPARAAVLDVGCGEGFYLNSIAGLGELECYGVDISTAAIDLAARSYPKICWLVANADRILPFVDGSLDLVISITARRNPGEFHRILAANGWLIVVIPAADDLVELRAELLGERILKSRIEQTLSFYAEKFELVEHRSIRHQARLTLAFLQDALASTYRGARLSQQERLAGLNEMDVTLSRDLLLLRPR